MTSPSPHFSISSKPRRIIVCCDGTWVNSLGDGDGPLSNVTRFSRSLKRVCSDGTSQIAYYHPGVGTGGLLDKVLGGVFGTGLDADIREGYNFVCANYVDSDEIYLLGFSRGAFTARSIADLIASVGLLTTKGLTHFYDIFEDYESMADENRSPTDFLDDSYDYLTPYRGETGKAKILWENKRKQEYKQWLKGRDWTRDTFADQITPITIKAVAVWDTVGSLGIPPMPVIGLHGSASQWKFTSTQISSQVENAFQALAIDEPRASFRPALWERLEDNTTTHLKQVWFPGSHGNIGGGWFDQQIACITLAWICDQLTPLGLEFSDHRLTALFKSSLRYSAAHPYPYIPPPSLFLPAWAWTLLQRNRVPLPWAQTPLPCPPPGPTQRRDLANCTMKDHHPDGSPEELWRRYHPRPWGLGQTRYPDSWFTVVAGTGTRRPGCFMRVDADTNEDTTEPLLNTNERVHASVRVRLVLRGMAMDDRGVWRCPALLRDDSRGGGRPVWRLAKDGSVDGARERKSNEGGWKWVLNRNAVVKNGMGKVIQPSVKVLPEEPMVGTWERCLLAMLKGDSDVWRLAEETMPSMEIVEGFTK